MTFIGKIKNKLKFALFRNLKRFKQITINRLIQSGANMANLCFRYYEKSPYQKKTFQT